MPEQSTVGRQAPSDHITQMQSALHTYCTIVRTQCKCTLSPTHDHPPFDCLPLWMIHKWGYRCPTIASVMRLMMTMMFDLWGRWSRSCWQWWPRWRWCEWDGGANAVGPLSHRAWQADLAAPWGALTHLPCGSIKSYSFKNPKVSPSQKWKPTQQPCCCVSIKSLSWCFGDPKSV